MQIKELAGITKKMNGKGLFNEYKVLVCDHKKVWLPSNVNVLTALNCVLKMVKTTHTHTHT